MLVVGLLCLVIFLSFHDSMSDYFVCDDFSHIVNNNQAMSWKGLIGMFTSLHVFGRWYRPLFELSIRLDWLLFGLNPEGYHFTSLVLYVLTTFLVYLIAGRLLGNKLFAVLSSVFFAVYGYHSEVVVWIGARADLLGTLFFLLAFFSYVLHEYQKRSQVAFTIGMLSFVLSLLCKESMVSLPLVLAGYELLILRHRWLTALKRTSPFWGILILYLPLRLVAGGGYRNLPTVLRFVAQVGYYLFSPFVVIPGDYLASRALEAWTMQPFLPLLTAFLSVIPLLLLIVGKVPVWREKTVLFGLLWLVATSLPVMTVAAERMTFLPSVGYAIAVGSATRLVWIRGKKIWKGNWGRFVMIGCVISLLLAHIITQQWRNFWWSESAKVVRQIIDDVQNLYPMPPSGSTFVFVNMPDNIHLAMNMRNVMPYALWLFYDDRSIKAYTSYDQDRLLLTTAEIQDFVEEITGDEKAFVLVYREGHLVDVTDEVYGTGDKE